MHSAGEFCTSAKNQLSMLCLPPLQQGRRGEGGTERSTLGSQTQAAVPLQGVCRKIMGVFSFGYKELCCSYKEGSSENHNNTGKSEMEL